MLRLLAVALMRLLLTVLLRLARITIRTAAIAGAIIDFAELKEKVDTPLRGWNDGAKLRLGFSIAVHTDPDILLVDEVMAVGDESFQNKCYRLIADLQARGKTILFVSHDLAVVERVASRIIWLNKGVIYRDGDVHSVMAEYRQFSELSR